MMRSTYQPAKFVAQTVEEHFSKLIAAGSTNGDKNLASVPEAKIVEAIIDTTFWASLQREEGHAPKISLAFLPPEQAEEAILFDQTLPFNAYTLNKIAPGVERPGIHLGVWRSGETLFIWGTSTSLPSFCFVVDVSEPGLLVIKHRRVDGFGKFANVAVLTGDQVKVISDQSASLPDCPKIITSILGFTSPSYWNKAANVLVQLAVSMRSHGRGGALLIVPTENNHWRASILQPVNYAVSPPYSGLSVLLQKHNEEDELRNWQGVLRKEIDYIAGLTAIDGATIINDKYQLLAFGAKIARPDGKPLIEKLLVTEPIVGVSPSIVHPSKMGGTRHLSAAQFVYDQPECMALVASQDGRFTVFSWSPCEQVVQAYRIDTLLL